jgi:hypothetical protein
MRINRLGKTYDCIRVCINFFFCFNIQVRDFNSEAVDKIFLLRVYT